MSNEQEIRQIVEKIDPKGELSQSVQEELIIALSEVKTDSVNKKVPVASIEYAIKEEMKNETDWRKRASLAAKIISINLD